MYKTCMRFGWVVHVLGPQGCCTELMSPCFVYIQIKCRFLYWIGDVWCINSLTYTGAFSLFLWNAKNGAFFWERCLFTTWGQVAMAISPSNMRACSCGIFSVWESTPIKDLKQHTLSSGSYTRRQLAMTDMDMQLQVSQLSVVTPFFLFLK